MLSLEIYHVVLFILTTKLISSDACLFAHSKQLDIFGLYLHPVHTTATRIFALTSSGLNKLIQSTVYCHANSSNVFQMHTYAKYSQKPL